MQIQLWTIFLLFNMAISTLAFTPNNFKRAFVTLNSDDSTHASITEAGIKRAVAAYYKETKRKPPAKTGGTAQQKGLLDTIGGIFSPSSGDSGCSGYQKAIQEIVNGNAATDSGDYVNRADLHFDAELFQETNANIISMRQFAKNNVSQNRYPEARKAIGHALHMVQDFYSHSNWVEMNMHRTTPGLGNKMGWGVPVAARKTPTCKPCQDIGECKDNVIVKNLLTSGYFQSVAPFTPLEKDAKGNSVEKPTDVAKCSHGGVIDKSAHAEPGGGINKDTSTSQSSPHHYLHRRAADLAEQSTVEFITSFRKEIGNKKFDAFLSLGQTACRRRKARSPLNSDQTKPTITHSVSSTPSYALTSGLVHIEWVIFDFTTGPLVVPVDSTLDEIVVNITTFSQSEEEKTISLTSPNGFQHSFKAISKPAESVYIRIQTPQPGAWRVEMTGATGRHSVSVLGSSHWGPIIDLMTVQDRSRHVMRPTMRVISADELISGSIIFAYILTPEEEADVTGVEVRNVHGAVIDNLSIAMEPIIEHDFSRRLIEFIVPHEEFRLVIIGKDKRGFDVIRVSEVTYKPKGSSMTLFQLENMDYLEAKDKDYGQNGRFNIALSASAIYILVLLVVFAVLALTILHIFTTIYRPRSPAIVLSKEDYLKTVP